MLSRRRFLSQCAAGLAWKLAGCSSARPPNLLLLLADDQRWDTLGAAGNSVIRTPHLDGLAARGVLFSNAFVTTSICPSSRASILTGRATSRHGVRGFGVALRPGDAAASYPALLRAAGYRTGFVGKWGLGGRPPARLFDFDRSFPGQGEYFVEIAGERRHIDGLLAEQALEFLEDSAGEPFCLSVSFKAPHAPWKDFDPAFAALYRGERMPLARTATPEASRRLPDFLRQSRGGSWWAQPEHPERALEAMTRRYYRLISGLDAAVGRVLAALEARGWSDDTVVVFSSDNGVFLGEHGLTGKWLMFEEAIRVPLVIADPRLPAERRGTRCERLALNLDLAPTLLDCAGLAAPAAMQGRSLLPLLRGEAPAWRSDFLYEMPALPEEGVVGCEGLRGERWKYIRYAGTQPPRESLFDLARDPGEENDLSLDPQHAGVLREWRERWRSHPERAAAAGA